MVGIETKETLMEKVDIKKVKEIRRFLFFLLLLKKLNVLKMN